jgi:hypothetical protein
MAVLSRSASAGISLAFSGDAEIVRRPGLGESFVKTENDAHRYYCEAAECELNAEKATDPADREAWKCLADDWMKLARAAEGNPFIETLRF